MRIKFFALLFFVFLFALFFAGIIFAAALLVNQPEVGGKLQILLEGGENSSVQVELPGGQAVDVMLQGGQGEIDATSPGRYVVRAGGVEKVVLVEEKPPEILLGVREGGEGISPVVIVMAVASLAVLAAVGVAVWRFFGVERKPDAPALSKWREGGKVLLEFCAGAAPLSDVAVVDPVGKGWEGKPIAIRKKSMKAYEKARVIYEWGGELSRARAHYVCEGKKGEIGAGEKENDGAGHEGEGRETGASKGGVKKEKRKLARA